MEKLEPSLAQKITYLIGFVFFGLASFAQVNDMSQYGTEQWLTYLWIFAYAALSLLCLVNIFRLLPSRIFLSLSLITFALAVFRATHIDFSQPIFCFTTPTDFAERFPEGNETGGLLLMTLWLILMWFLNRRREKHLFPNQSPKSVVS